MFLHDEENVCALFLEVDRRRGGKVLYAEFRPAPTLISVYRVEDDSLPGIQLPQAGRVRVSDVR